jgi:murein DD-endopeptidase MepM/ murein hydrolase activator NlpD
MSGTHRAAGAASAVTAVVVLFALVLAAAGSAIGGEEISRAAATPSSSADLAANVPPGRPCAQPLETQGFKPGPGAYEPNHTGIDFSCLGDRTLVAVLPGTVSLVKSADCPVQTPAFGYGCNVVIETHVNGHVLFSRYAHAVPGTAVVSAGQEVAAGTPLEVEDSTGWSTGPHVHFEVDDGAPTPERAINPAPFLDRSILG